MKSACPKVAVRRAMHGDESALEEPGVAALTEPYGSARLPLKEDVWLPPRCPRRHRPCVTSRAVPELVHRAASRRDPTRRPEARDPIRVEMRRRHHGEGRCRVKELETGADVRRTERVGGALFKLAVVAHSPVRHEEPGPPLATLHDERSYQAVWNLASEDCGALPDARIEVGHKPTARDKSLETVRDALLSAEGERSRSRLDKSRRIALPEPNDCSARVLRPIH